MTIKTKPQRFISLILIVAILAPTVLFSTPKSAGAFKENVPQEQPQSVPTKNPVSTAGIWLSKALLAIGVPAEVASKILAGKDWAQKVLMEAAKAAAMKALQDITKSTVNWINQGYHGMPLFLENPESFFKDIDKFEVRTLIDLYGYDELKFPFGKEFALNTISAYKGTLADNSAYSLSNYLVNDPVLLKNYQNDFNTGGWNGFLINTQSPQNNYIGFQMLANEELAGRIQGKAGTAKDKVNKLLDQGMGFLSPQICQTNPDYNDMKNEFNAPTWNPAKWEADNPYEPPECDGSDYSTTPDPTTGICTAEVNYDTLYYQRQEAAKRAWHSKENPDYCPPHGDGSSGLANVTPGAVVANQIFDSVKPPSELKKQAVNSGSLIVSAVIDQLLSKYLNKGLSSLASAINPPDSEEDEWSYNGLTLGGSSTVGGPDDPWDSGPDEVVTVADFQEKLAQDIEKTETEIKYMTNSVPDSFGPGTMQALGQIWPKVQTLDVCQPGPDIKWKERLENQLFANQGKLSGGTAGEEAELAYAVGVFEEWLTTQLKYTLPSSPSFMTTVNNLPDLSQQAIQVEDKIDTKENTLIQLRLIKTQLDVLPPAPAAGSEDEGTLLSLWAQRKSIAAEISSDITLGTARSERDTALALAKKNGILDQLIIKCGEERAAKGWEAQGGAQSKLASPSATEQTYFCDWPIAGGYSHKMFVNPAEPTYPQIPLVNAQNIAVGTASVNITMSCGTIFNANMLDYKGDLPSF